jgi:hypothetical protein
MSGNCLVYKIIRIIRYGFNLISSMILPVVGIATFFILFLIIFTFFHPTFMFSQIDPTLANKLGDFIGGYFGTIILIITAFLLYATLQEQKKAFTLQSFESKFYDLLKIHRDNVAEMKLDPREGRSVFVILRAEFQDIYEIVKKYYIKNDANNQAKANISYILLFFGAKNSGAEMAMSLLEKYDKTEIQEIISALSKIKTIGCCKYLKEYTKMTDYQPFNGHQSRLGHYFRHLYQTVKFVDKRIILNEENKKYYVKTLRAQLSNHELALFFYNSLSDIGKNWRTGEKGEKEGFIEKYKLLKNIPLSGFTYELDPPTFYSEQDYEWYEIKKNIV